MCKREFVVPVSVLFRPTYRNFCWRVLRPARQHAATSASGVSRSSAALNLPNGLRSDQLNSSNVRVRATPHNRALRERLCFFSRCKRPSQFDERNPIRLRSLNISPEMGGLLRARNYRTEDGRGGKQQKTGMKKCQASTKRNTGFVFLWRPRHQQSQTQALVFLIIYPW